MKKKTFSLLLTGLLLASCSRANAPQELVSYIDNCSLAKAKEEVKTIIYNYENIVKDRDDNTLSKLTMVEYWDNSNSEDFYKYQEENYEGEKVYFNEEYNLYEIKRINYTHYIQEENLYYVDTMIYGYENKDLTGEMKNYKLSPAKYPVTAMNDVIYKIFASQMTMGMNQGGLYYADFMDSNLTYYPYMSIVDDLFVLELKDYPYKTESESGLIQEKVRMNSFGLLVDFYQDANNGGTGKSSIVNASASYNQDITHKSL
jgi:hypothetical protein